MKNILLAGILFCLVPFSTSAELKCWFGFENAAYGTSLNGYTTIDPDYRINTGYAWVNTANPCGVIENHKIAPFASITNTTPWYPHFGYGATFPVTITAKLAVSGNNIPVGIITRYRNDIMSYTNAGIGAFIKSTSGNLAVGVGTINNSGTWVSVSSTAAIYPITFDQMYELTVCDYGGPLGGTLCAYFDISGNTPTTLRIESWVSYNPSWVPYLKAGITRGGVARSVFFDDVRLSDASGAEPTNTPTNTPTFTPTPTKTPTPFHPIPGITPIPCRGWFTWRPENAPEDHWVMKALSSDTGNTLTVAYPIQWTNLLVCADGNTVDCAGDTLILVRWYPYGTYNYDPIVTTDWGNEHGEMSGELSQKIIVHLNSKNGYPTLEFTNPTSNLVQLVDTRGSWTTTNPYNIEYGGVSITAGTVLFNCKPEGTPPVSQVGTYYTLPGPIGAGTNPKQGITRGKLSLSSNPDRMWFYSYDDAYKVVPIEYSIDTWQSFGWLHREDGLYAWKDGTYSGVSDVCGDMVSNNSGLKFGTNYNANGSFDGFIQSIVYFLEALTDEEMAISMNYLDDLDALTPTPTATPAVSITPTPTITPTLTFTVTATPDPQRKKLIYDNTRRDLKYDNTRRDLIYDSERRTLKKR